MEHVERPLHHPKATLAAVINTTYGRLVSSCKHMIEELVLTQDQNDVLVSVWQKLTDTEHVHAHLLSNPSSRTSVILPSGETDHIPVTEAIKRAISDLESTLEQAYVESVRIEIVWFRSYLLHELNQMFAAYGVLIELKDPKNPIRKIEQATSLKEIQEAMNDLITLLPPALKQKANEPMIAFKANQIHSEECKTRYALAVCRSFFERSHQIVTAREQEERDHNQETLRQLATASLTGTSVTLEGATHTVEVRHAIGSVEKPDEYIQTLHIGDSQYDLHIERQTIARKKHFDGPVDETVTWHVVKVGSIANGKKKLTKLNRKLATSPLALSGHGEIDEIAKEIVLAEQPWITRDQIKAVFGKLPSFPSLTRNTVGVVGVLALATAAALGARTYQSSPDSHQPSRQTTAHTATPRTPRTTVVMSRTNSNPTRTNTVTSPIVTDTPHIPSPESTRRISTTLPSTPTILARFSPHTPHQANAEFALRNLLDRAPSVLGHGSAVGLAHAWGSKDSDSLVSRARAAADRELADRHTRGISDPRLANWSHSGHRMHTHVNDTFELQRNGSTVSLVHTDSHGVRLYEVPLTTVGSRTPTRTSARIDNAPANTHTVSSSAYVSETISPQTNDTVYLEPTSELFASLDALRRNPEQIEPTETKTYLDPSSAAYQDMMQADDKQYFDERAQRETLGSLASKRTVGQRIRGFLRSIFAS